MVVIGIGTLVDLRWHQRHPMASDMSMNVVALPGHQIILGGFGLGLAGALAGLGGIGRRSMKEVA